jgi:hypothetical protein
MSNAAKGVFYSTGRWGGMRDATAPCTALSCVVERTTEALDVARC